MAVEAVTRRLFFALWPDPLTRARLADSVNPALEAMPGRRVPVENWHVTVAFLGEVGVGHQACVEAVAEGVHGVPFTLELDHYGHWPRPQVVWLGSRVCPAPLQQLVQDLGKGLRACGVETDARPFAVHLTVLRQVRERPRLPRRETFAWHVDSLALVESQLRDAGAAYRVLRAWPFST